MAEPSRESRLQAAREAIRENVCRACLDVRDDGTCGLTRRECAIERHLPQVVDAISSVSSPHIDEYIEAVRARVCSVCTQDDSDQCPLRDSGECTLNSYLAFVVDAIDGLPAE